MPVADDDFDEAFDEEFDDDFGEAAPTRFRPPRLTTARPTPLPPRPVDRPVTQTQLQTAVQKLNGDIARNSTAIQRVNQSMTTLGREVRRNGTQTRSTRKDIGQIRDAVMLLPLLSRSMGDGNNPMLAALLPMMMLSGVGEGQGSGQSGAFGGDQSTTMLMVLALSGGLGRQ